MKVGISLVVIVLLTAIALVGAGVGLNFVFGVIIPYAAIAIFLIGVVYRVLKWAKAPVPFRIPTTSGQQKSLDWIKNDNLESPHNTLGVIGRMLLEVLFFRSLFRNTKTELKDNSKLVYGSSKWLWAGGMAFHWSFLIIFLRHFKYFVQPTPKWVMLLQDVDSFFQIGLPIVYITDFLILAALTFLFLRRVMDSRLRYMSLLNDYFPLLLIIGIATTGVLMRYFIKVDIISIKELGTGLLSFHPILPEGVNPLFYLHFFYVCTLIAYFPFSKLMHMGGVFLSPTRNLANNNRAKRHINPWNPEVKVHTYQEYEEEFHDVMKAAGLPLDKE
ncbi:MAG: sulfate reduction electron transfer complex DsrMKJOP subunit DsrM [Candidatus Electryonea clarkiae]|nr:sulfate reduction electron transfer complex DsrMKJOP subunit DsrM [Candidatus Electryonea clarkiae]MDP8288357.1 sulfate reduction electron transfer complex DsrMKJOP subunit DsrM [Candidatus Electryonea clarkiae]